ncbi:PREDICTED: UPF0481 protein At3g47200-like [Nelumbo nucifera]|uniref:UPF0481 protein At3g47200-like n=1 Tax=Nelumbo nucifera TaxID=4432 RepID=A0A1U8Q7I6_NELNU|nr:PREDICTED: UPF0481 protein At3g47200-like [Nelumbo nucifera]
MEWTWAPMNDSGSSPLSEKMERTWASIVGIEPSHQERMEWTWEPMTGSEPPPPDMVEWTWASIPGIGSSPPERMECNWAPMDGSMPPPYLERERAPQGKGERHGKLSESIIQDCGLRDNTKPPKSLSSIYRIPKALVKINEKVYVPQIVSIGPFYYTIKHDTRKQKNKYLRYFLRRNPNCSWETTLDSCVEALKEEEKKARRWYSEEIESINSNEFVTMMLVDGCFILELLCRMYEKNNPQPAVIGNKTQDNNDDEEGPVSKKMLPRIRHDMLLLQNQLPLFILDRLFEKTIIHISPIPLNELVFHFFRDITPIHVHDLRDKPKHILHLLRQFMRASSKLEITGKSSEEAKLSNYSVTQLKEAGVKFLKKENTDSFLDISFRNGVLEIPKIHVQNYTECLLKNLIAFEQYFPKCSGRITSYAFLMDSLINTPEDVQYLYKKGIITHGLGNHEEVSDLFNDLRKGAFLHHFYYEDVCTDLNNHFDKRWKVWGAIFKRERLKNPWTIVSLIVATLFFVLTFSSSLFSVLSFFVHGS